MQEAIDEHESPKLKLRKMRINFQDEKEIRIHKWLDE